MYVEHNDSESPNRDWELSVEFYPEEREEYKFYIAASKGQVEVRSEVPRKRKQKARRRKATRPRQHVHKRVLRRTCR